jgi:MerR family copper efflux transcriptional regulator
MAEELLRIGEVATRADVSTRTVDYYTGLGLLTPVRRSGGNFRLYRPTDVQRIAAVRHLEAQGIPLDDIVHALTTPARDDHTGCEDRDQGHCPADPVALAGYLDALDAQVQALRGVAQTSDPETRGVLATLASRAQSLIATALLLGAGGLLSGDVMPPF